MDHYCDKRHMQNTNILNNKQSYNFIKWSSIAFLPIIALLLLPTSNETLFIWLNSRMIEWLGSSFWALLTNFGDGFFLFPLTMIIVRNNPERQQTLLISCILAALALNLGKHIIDSARPLKVLGEALITMIGPEVKHFTMPSGHSGTIFILAGLSILYLRHHAATFVIIFSIIVAISRVAVGAHWPIDVVIGAWIGLMSTAAGALISRRFKVGFFIRIFYIFIGFIPSILLPFYNNGFQSFTVVQNTQYLLAILSFTLSLFEIKTLSRDYTAKRKQKS